MSSKFSLEPYMETVTGDMDQLPDVVPSAFRWIETREGGWPNAGLESRVLFFFEKLSMVRKQSGKRTREEHRETLIKRIDRRENEIGSEE